MSVKGISTLTSWIEWILRVIDRNDVNNSEAVLKMALVDDRTNNTFGRKPVANLFGVADNKSIHKIDDGVYQQRTVGAGTISYVYNESSIALTVGTTIGDKALIQTWRYYAYVPGNEMVHEFTSVVGAAVPGVRVRLGPFDDLNGIFFEQGSDGIMYVVVRTSTSGSASDAYKIPQAQWNVDTLDGSGTTANPSGLTLNMTAGLIFDIRYQWLGYGSVEFAIVVNERRYVVHRARHSNDPAYGVVYMKSGSLPVRYEIENVLGSAAGKTIKATCQSISSDGGYRPAGWEHSINNDGVGISCATGTPTLVMAVRLTNTHQLAPVSTPNRTTAQVIHMSAMADVKPCYIELIHADVPTFTGGTWTPVDPESALEFSYDTVLSGGTAHKIHTIYVPAGGNNSTSVAAALDYISNHSFISQNIESNKSQAIIVRAAGIGGSSTVYASLDLVEYD